MLCIPDTVFSENATFAQRLAEEGITSLIGPSPDSLRLLGDKIAAREAMSNAGIPVARATMNHSIPRRH